MILAGFITKAIIRVVEKADDRRIAKSLHKRIKKLEKESHPRADWICMDCGCKAKKVEKPTRRK